MNEKLQELFFLIGLEKIEKVKALLLSQDVEGLNLNERDTSGKTLFISACKLGNLDIVELLLKEKRIDVNLTDKTGRTGFLTACIYNRVQIVKLLLTHERVDVNKSDLRKNSPFPYVCRHGYWELVRILIQDERILDLNTQDHAGRTPFFLICETDKPEIVELLFADQRIDFSRPTVSGTTALMIACLNGHIDVVRLFLENYKRINFDLNFLNKDGKTAFYIASERGEKEIVQLMLGYDDIDINKGDEKDITPLMISCIRNKVETVRVLLTDPRLNINYRNEKQQTAFYLSCFHTRFEIAKLLLQDKRMTLDQETEQGIIAIWTALLNGSLDILQLIISRSTEINFENGLKILAENPLLKSKFEEKKQIVQLLSDLQINPQNTILSCTQDLAVKGNYFILILFFYF